MKEWQLHRKTQSVGSGLGSATQQTKSGCALVLHWLNASKSILGAIAVLALVGYAVFFPHPEHGPREIASEILPRNARVADMKGAPRDVPAWRELHEQYVQEIKFKAARKETVDLVFYGDSITESFRGLQVGVPLEKFKEIPTAFAKAYGSVKTAVYSISGDRTEHLYWRIENEEGVKDLKPKAVVVLIGTNDLDHVDNLQDLDDVSTKVGAGNVAIVETLLQQLSSTRIILVGLLPRGDRSVEAPSVAFHQPSKYTPAIEAVNNKLKAYSQLNTRVDFVDCGQQFLEDDDRVEGGKRLKKKLIPDSLHPSADGIEVLAKCLQPSLKQYGLQTAENRRLLWRQKQSFANGAE